MHLVHLAQKHHNHPKSSSCWKIFYVHEVLLEQVAKIDDKGFVEGGSV